MRQCSAALLAVALSLGLCATAHAQTAGSHDRTGDWALEDGFRISLDAGGFSMPAALAFVPNPGGAGDDPLYFVLELRGTVKVVTNDRSVHTFADLRSLGYSYSPVAELPEGYGQGGAAGLCLDPAGGHVVVTFIYSDKAGRVRYNLIRFDTRPGTFARSYEDHRDFVDLFSSVVGAITHQIGPCLVRNGELFLSVGEAWQPFEAQNLDSPLGKILRMDLEGAPIAGNPFYGAGTAGGFRDYIWAYGLRNPFSLAFVNDRLFVADNGIALDRFLEVEPGRNYLYNGSDSAIAANARYVWQPSLAPVQMAFVPAGGLGFPEAFTNTFFVALAGDIGRGKKPGIYGLRYDLEADLVTAVPGYFARYEGAEFDMATGLAVGPDGLYFTSLSPASAGATSIYRITYDAANAHARTLRTERRVAAVLRERGCLGCHALYEDGNLTGGRYGAGIGPPLVPGREMLDRLDQRLNTETYESHLRMLMESETYSNPEYDALREQVLAATGEDRIATWLKHFIQNPDFDKTYIPQMPDVGLTDEEADGIVAYLVRGPDSPGIAARIRGLVPRPLRAVHLAVSFLMGSVLTVVAGGVALILVRRGSRS